KKSARRIVILRRVVSTRTGKRKMAPKWRRQANPRKCDQCGNVTALARDHHLGADADAFVEIEHVGVVHADATIGYEPADRARYVGAVDGVLAAAERQGGLAHRVARTAARDQVRQGRLVALDVARWRPRRPAIFAADVGLPGPLLAGPADAHRVADRMAVADDEIE